MRRMLVTLLMYTNVQVKAGWLELGGEDFVGGSSRSIICNFNL